MNIMKTILSIALLLVLGSATYGLPVVEWNTISYAGGWGVGSELRGEWSSGAGIWGYSLTGHEYGTDYIELYADSGTAGISHQWFEVTYGELIDVSTAASSDALARITTAHPIEYGSLRVYEGYPCYLGVQLGGYPGSLGLVEFGWAEFSYDGTDLTMISSASERTGLGIYAGTGTAVPEPTTAGLLIIGAAGIIWKRRRTSEGLVVCAATLQSWVEQAKRTGE